MIKFSLIVILLSIFVGCGSHKSENFGYVSNNDVNEVVDDKSLGGQIKLSMDSGDIDSFKNLITLSNLNVRLPESNNATPLIYAAIKNLSPYAYHLIKLGAVTDLKDDANKTALDHALEIWGQGRIIMLLDPQIQMQGQKELMTAVKRKRVPSIEKLLNDGIDPNFIDEESGETPLTQSVLLVKGAHVTGFLANWKDVSLGISTTDINFPNSKGQTPLGFAIENNNREVIDLLRSLNAKEQL